MLVGEKIRESALSVAPIVILVTLLCLSISPLPSDLLLSFLVGAVLLILGMGFFTLGAEVSMSPIGTRIGAALTRTRKLPLILLVSFLLGFAITVAEPDLQVLANSVPHINSTVLIVTVGVGVGFFLSLCMLRILVGIRLRWLLFIFYGLVFLLASLSDPNFLSVAFDAGGVTTGPMTVPFILALGMGVANIRSDSAAESDSFGLVALCSIGPILAVLILGFFYPAADVGISLVSTTYPNTAAIGEAYLHAVPHTMLEMAVALSPIVLIFLLFQLFSLKLSRRNLHKILLGILYTYLGLVLFLTGVNVGFSSLGTVLGATLANGWTNLLLIPLSALLGYFIISAEPAVYVLEKQIEEVSAGAIPKSAVKISLSVAIALAMALAMLRVKTGISILYFLLPGYGIALLLSFFVPDIYTAIAFDSGGVASGPMTATFMLQLMMGASTALGGNVLRDAFGLVAMVAMMPLISIQVMGLLYCRKKEKDPAHILDYSDLDIIELWEESL